MSARPSPRPVPRIRRQAGVSLVELLIALLLFAFGMLGLAGLQTRSLWYGQSSLYRSQATALTDDILDRMRADRAKAKSGEWDTEVSVHAASITGSQLHQVDLKDWKRQVETLLPSGEASIATTSDGTTVIIQWDDTRGRESEPQKMKTFSRL